MTNIKNILLIGRAGGGKSTLSNVLSGTSGFRESASLIPETREIQTKKFELEIDDRKERYQIIDTVGLGDPNLTEREIAIKIVEVCRELENGLTQVMFVVGGRITQEEIKIFNTIKKTIFDKEVFRHTTVVRTNFPSFRDKDMCNKDRDKLKKENRKFNKLIDSCNGVVYVDNPSLGLGYSEEEIKLNMKRREESRDILREHLTKNCQSFYNPPNLKSIKERFNGGSADFEEYIEKELEKIERKKEKSNFAGKVKQLVNVTKKEFFQAVVEIKDYCKVM